MANTLTPTTDAEGNVTGYDLQQDNGGHWKGNQQDYVEFQDGSVHHRFENVEVNEDDFDYDAYTDYYDTLAKSIPNLPVVLDWASNYLPQNYIQEYNDALEANDLETVNQTLEHIVALYGEQGSSKFQEEQDYRNEEEDDSEEDWTEEDQEELNDTISQLYEAEPQGEEYAESWQSVVEQAQEVGDDTYAAVAAATAAFHNGEVSAEEAVNYVLSNFDIRDVERVYRHMTQS